MIKEKEIRTEKSSTGIKVLNTSAQVDSGEVKQSLEVRKTWQ